MKVTLLPQVVLAMTPEQCDHRALTTRNLAPKMHMLPFSSITSSSSVFVQDMSRQSSRYPTMDIPGFFAFPLVNVMPSKNKPRSHKSCSASQGWPGTAGLPVARTTSPSAKTIDCTSLLPNGGASSSRALCAAVCLQDHDSCRGIRASHGICGGHCSSQTRTQIGFAETLLQGHRSPRPFDAPVLKFILIFIFTCPYFIQSSLDHETIP